MKGGPYIKKNVRENRSFVNTTGYEELPATARRHRLFMVKHGSENG